MKELPVAISLSGDDNAASVRQATLAEREDMADGFGNGAVRSRALGFNLILPPELGAKPSSRPT